MGGEGGEVGTWEGAHIPLDQTSPQPRSESLDVQRSQASDPNAQAAAAAEKFTSVKNLAARSLQVKVIIDYSWGMPDSCHDFKIFHSLVRRKEKNASESINDTSYL